MFRNACVSVRFENRNEHNFSFGDPLKKKKKQNQPARNRVDRKLFEVLLPRDSIASEADGTYRLLAYSLLSLWTFTRVYFRAFRSHAEHRETATLSERVLEILV